MTMDENLRKRLQFLGRVVEKEVAHLKSTDTRLFVRTFDVQRVKAMDSDMELAERVEAFVSRFGRLQDTLADKLLPALLTALGEKTGAVIDNLDRAERLGFIDSADNWMAMRKLRNQMIHEYVEDPEILASALRSGHGFVPTLTLVAEKIIAEITKRNWA